MTWCHVPETGFPFAPAPVALILASCLPSRDFTPAALSSGRTIPAKPSSQASAPDTSHPPRSGMTSPHLTPDPLPGTSTPFWPDTPASRSAPQASAKVPTIPGTSGPMSPASSANVGPFGCSLKTWAVMSRLASTPSCVTYGEWVTRLRLACLQRQKRARRMNASGCSSWPTATSVMTTGAGHEGRDGGLNLQTAAASWPTPAAQNWKGSSEASVTRADGKSRMDVLHYRAEQGFTHPAPATQPHGPTLSQLRPIWRPLRASLIASHGRATWRRLWKGRTKRRLNPGFVEWLMGWPPGHALCACSETAFTRWQQDMRGALLALPMDCGPWIWKPPTQTAPTQMTLL